MKKVRVDSKELEIDRAVYLVNDATKTYRFLRRNPEWSNLAPEVNERNKRHLDGYTRIFPDGRRKVFRYRPPYTTPTRSGSRRRGSPKVTRSLLGTADR